MKAKNVLITGGAGFIGQHLSRALLKKGCNIRIVDSFSPQIHTVGAISADLLSQVELICADIRDREAMKQALMGIDTVVHLAAETGTGQSMYAIEHYFNVNVQATAILLNLLQEDSIKKNMRSIVLASSRAVYGEGAYHCADHGVVYPNQRTWNLMTSGQFEPVCPECHKIINLLPTPESAPFKPMSIYGLTKQVQEQAILLYAQMAGINGIALRYQNVYGPGQSLKNPYTGILAIFSNLARQDQDIEIYEDGMESRDFVYIDDVVAITVDSVMYQGDFVGALNVGSGRHVDVFSVAKQIKKFFNSSSKIIITGKFRVGDIRHNVANIQFAQRIFGYSPNVTFEDGLDSFLSWAAVQPTQDKLAYQKSVAELANQNLMGKQIN
ncbi:MAG: NAD-dependent epimerase/dehydratase family protein [Candidatus Electronema sp. V4]|uniref:NAD-dependent epimerase/dehydratase family protein n=1 Tax=Candidatus Electronema sp. V4 TaxID=3454756 RepID=UPI0040558F05